MSTSLPQFHNCRHGQTPFKHSSLLAFFIVVGSSHQHEDSFCIQLDLVSSLKLQLIFLNQNFLPKPFLESTFLSEPNPETDTFLVGTVQNPIQLKCSIKCLLMSTSLPQFHNCRHGQNPFECSSLLAFLLQLALRTSTKTVSVSSQIQFQTLSFNCSF